MRRFLVILLLTVAIGMPLPAATFAQGKSKAVAVAANAPAAHGVDLITAAQMRDYLYFIASDEMEGRDTPSRGLNTVAKFIAMNLSRWGFKPAGDNGTFFQNIALKRNKVDVAHTSATINGQTFTPGTDFIAFSNAGTVSGPLVYAGNGWFIKSKNIDAYQGIDVKDKIVVISSEGLPKGVTPQEVFGGGKKKGVDWADPLTYAEMRGAKGVIAIATQQIVGNWEVVRSRIQDNAPVAVEKFQKEGEAKQIPRIIVSPKMAAALLAGEKQTVEVVTESIAKGEPIANFEFGAAKQVSFTVAANNDNNSTQNVVAIWEGSDPTLKSEYVAVGAHYDHVGIGNPDKNGDTIYNGADDDGSGTTGVLAMAEAIAHTNPRPKRSILFVWHCGEEKGLWGSQYFTDNPTVPLDKVVTQLNIDMIGRSKKDGDTNPRNAELSGPNEIYVIGSKMMSTELGQMTEDVNKSFLNLTLNYKYDDPNDPNRFFFRSDHFNYARKGIPIAFFFDGEHEDYHRPGDSPDKIDYDKMQKVTRTIYTLLWEIANRPTRPKVDKQLPAQLTGN
ncbi:MAG: M20/M25/M40 family metallo-hydrolase [Pyrinomonadaceae bacterium]